MKGRVFKVFTSSALAVGLLAGCSSGGGAGAGKTLADGDTVTIGLNFELSGGTASYGTAEYNGAKLAIDQYNASDDAKYKIEIAEQDNKGDNAESTTAATRLITEDGASILIGPATSGTSIATYQVASDNAVPVISPSATQIDATTNDNGETYPYAFRICFEDSYQGAAMAQYAYDTLGVKKAAIINEVSDYGQGLVSTFKDVFTEKGGEVVAEQSYNSGDTDFASILTDMKSKDFDVLYIAGYYQEAGLIIKQARDMGIDTPIIGADGFESEVLSQLAGADNLSNTYYTTCYTTLNASDELTNFIDSYTEEYGEAPNMFSALAYDSANLALQALEEAGATGEELKNMLEGIEFSGITGSFTFDDTHSPIKTVMIVELENGVQTAATEVEVEQ
ncbi:MAG: ABC transporter substrate-binding protein [Faecalicoccus sp.]|uniref:ABC transporter substrate-binding protein n=1 Tax=Faecalicoccus sp. TaxID=1971758 RepID=UPI002A8388AE|nr:ABC transporter substrate-binding protein [Faecalicoccus sp.]MCI6380577.1 ABC transporter substrate-binding protein [Erysipelotrichaceae bacterium]MDY4869864.1 ABC transporter substrate-binding protein [Faecalicoccus sp.]